MKFSNKLSLLVITFIISILGYSQKGKNGTSTISSANTIVNSYTYLTSNASSGATSIAVNNNSMTGGSFSGTLAQGDLILVIQMQGASMDIDPTPAMPLASGGWGGSYTVPTNSLSLDWKTLADIWGRVLNYNQAGKFEQVEVLSITGTNTINLNCPLSNNYTSAGHVQVVRVPRYQDLTINTGASITTSAWNGQVGGIVAVEVAGNLSINGTGKLTASGLGFRGGVADNLGSTASSVGTSGSGQGDTFLGSNNGGEGARKGEGIGGYTTEYQALYSIYGRSAPANGGGGAGYQNAGGGGGANVGSGTYTGKGIPDPAYNAIWNIEKSGFGGTSSPGGGRGGYTLSNSNQNETTVGPNNSLWGTGYRKVEGGLGGHSLTYDNTRIFMGGGGGAGDQDNSQGGSGGAGGGIVFATIYGTISGTGSIEVNGGAGLNSNPTNAAPTIGAKKGTDGAGGAGGAGSIYIKNSSPIPSTIVLNSNGGKGGDNAITLGTGITTVTEANGPGAGGAGGAIAFSSGTPTQSVNGGANGVVLVSGSSSGSPISLFPPNGATKGGLGMSSLSTTIYDIVAVNDTICSGQTATLSVNVTGTLPAGGTIYWYTQQYGGTSIGSGTSFTTSALTVTTNYYAGVCPGTFRIPVKAVVNPNPLISGTAVITNAGCTILGSISGLSVSGGTTPYVYSWNSVITSSTNLTNAGIGTYNLLVTDAKGCTDTDGPYSIVGSSGPVINSTGVIVTNQSCNGVQGSIIGITASGSGLTYSWSNGGGTTLNATNLNPGSYTLTVTDNSGCSATAGPYVINASQGPVINATGITITQSTCGNANGAITGITVSGSGLTYNWNNGLASTLDISNQPAGNYTLIVTDGNGCSVTSSVFTIPSSGSLTMNSNNAIVQNEHCSHSDGSINDVIVTGGTAPLTYSWTNTTQNTLNIINLTAGTYTLTVTDGSGCIATSSPLVVTNVLAPTINTSTVNITNSTCSLANGGVSGLTVAGGTNPLSYLWTNSGGTSISASNLVAGNYSLTVTDAFGCSVASPVFTVNDSPGPIVNSTSMSIQSAGCGASSGAITGIVVTGNTPSYSWNNGLATSLDITNQPAGNYSLVITDINGCVSIAGPFTINSTGSLTLNTTNAVVLNEHCSQSDGSISGIIVTGGTNPISYSWTNSTQNTLDITGLSANSYTLTVTDANGCTAVSSPYAVTNSTPPSLDQSNVIITNESCLQNDGGISGLTASGGTNPLSYLWSNNGGTSINASNLVAGNYSLTVTDAFGCSFTSSPMTVNGSIPMSINTTNLNVTDRGCAQQDGAINGIQISGGVSPQYSWNNNQTTLSMNSLDSGTYVLNIVDIQGCTQTLSVHVGIKSSPVIDLTNMVVSSSHCGNSNGSISGVNVTGGTPDYIVRLNNQTLNNYNVISNQPSGVYQISVIDYAGCTDIKSITITEEVGPVINTNSMVLNPITCTELGSILGINVTGSGPFSCLWNNGVTSIDNANLSEGNYSLSVRDVFGCQTTSQEFNLTSTGKPTADFYWNPYMPSIGSEVHFNNNSSNAIAYSWSFGDGNYSSEFEPNHIYSDDAIKSYNVYLVAISDAGCTDTVFYTIEMNDDLLFYIPNSFTPNSDQTNNVFQPVFTQGIDKYDFSMLIYNRWGELIFESYDANQGWDGTYGGILQQDGAYSWKINFKMSQTDEKKLVIGHVNLIK